MLCSTCATSVLNNFIQDILGKGFPHSTRSSASRCLPSSSRYQFGTRATLRLRQTQLHGIPSAVATSVSPVDDYYIPFDRKYTGSGTLPSSNPSKHERSSPLSAITNRTMLPTKIPYQDPTIFLDHAQYRSGFEEEPDVELREDISPGEKSNDLPATSAPISSNRNGSELSFADGFGGTEEGEDAILELNSENIEALATEGEVKGSDCTPKFEEPHSIPPSSQSKRQRLSLDRDSERVASKTSPKFKVASKKVPLQAFKHGDRETWQIQKSALLEKFGSQSWTPRKRLSPDALEGIRALNAQYPNKYTTPVLADQFKVSPDAIRRILKSKWRPNDEEEADRRHRWDKRGEKIWTQMVELGVKPPKKWREMGVGKSDQSQDSDRIKKPRTKARTSNVARKPWSVNEEGFQRMRSDEPLPMEESLAERIL